MTTGCPVIVRVGIFFDGTGNNATNDIPKTDTNIARLHGLYYDQDDHPPPPMHGTPTYFYRHYLDGIGTAAGSERSGYAMGTGAGGVDKIAKALTEMDAAFEKHKDCSGLRIVDVFGFSRGAALARDFVNQVNEHYAEDGVKVGFVGLFDTVASFGLAGNNDNPRSDHPVLDEIVYPLLSPILSLFQTEYNFHLSSASAQRIAHFVAKDEKRANFPLHSLRSGSGGQTPHNASEYEVIGVHSDVGGGYSTNETNEVIEHDRLERRTISYQKVGPYQAGQPPAWQSSMLRQKESLEKQAEDQGLMLEYDHSTENAVGEVTDYYWLVQQRIVKGGLSNVYLHLMYQEALKAGVTMTPQGEFPQVLKPSHRHEVPEELHSYLNSRAQVDEGQAMFIRQHYVHTSHKDWEDANPDERWIAHRAELFDGERTIFYNEPSDAVDPE